MKKVKISKTIYTIIDRIEDEISICYKIQKGNTIKSLIQSKRRGTWDLWSGRNGIKEIGFPKPGKPEFLTEEEAAQQPKTRRRKSNVIRRNAHQKIRAIVESARKVICYSLNNDFTGVEVNNFTAEKVLGELQTKSTYFTDDNDYYIYTLHIHSNLWYKFDTTPRQAEITKIKVDCNTFSFSVEETGNKKIVFVNHHTDFSGTDLEKDFPNGTDTVWETEVDRSISDIEAINQVGRKLLEDWKDIQEEPEQEVIESSLSLTEEQETITVLEPTRQSVSDADSNELNQLAEKLIEFLTHNKIKASQNDEGKLIFNDNNDYQFTLDEMLKALTEAQLKAIEQAEAKLLETAKPSLNWFEKKQQKKKARYLEKAQKAKQESTGFYVASNDAVANIPVGQPILIGHHSERRHRKALKRSWNKLGKAVKAQEKAEYYLGKAAGVGNGGISSDDPDAIAQRLRKQTTQCCLRQIAKLTKQLDEAIALQEKMKQANKLIRKGDRKGLAEMGYTEQQINQLFTPDFCGRFGYADYKLKNNNANIRRLKTRIKELEEAAELESEEFVYDGLTIIHNVEENRVQLVFDSIPSKEFRQLLKSHGFRWSKANSAWQRHLNNAGVFEANYIKDKFLAEN